MGLAIYRLSIYMYSMLTLLCGGTGACVSTTELILVKFAQNPEYGKTKVYLERF